MELGHRRIGPGMQRIGETLPTSTPFTVVGTGQIRPTSRRAVRLTEIATRRHPYSGILNRHRRRIRRPRRTPTQFSTSEDKVGKVFGARRVVLFLALSMN